MSFYVRVFRFAMSCVPLFAHVYVHLLHASFIKFYVSHVLYFHFDVLCDLQALYLFLDVVINECIDCPNTMCSMKKSYFGYFDINIFYFKGFKNSNSWIGFLNEHRVKVWCHHILLFLKLFNISWNAKRYFKRWKIDS